MVKSLERHDLAIAVGPAGGGKTYAGVAIAVDAHRSKRISQIIITRPVIEAGEHLGFLPGDEKQKLAPYLAPIYDCLGKCGGETYSNASFIKVVPFAYARGYTFDDAYVIIDEAQNATLAQLELMTTRLGPNSKMLITGDPSQSDLPAGCSGLASFITMLKKYRLDVPIVQFSADDNLRHPLVGALVNMFECEGRALRGGRP